MLTGCDDQEKEVKEILRPVKSLIIESSDAARELVFSGISRSTEQTRLSFKISGTIQQLAHKLGDVVKAGQLIAELDPVSYQLQALEAKANLSSTKASQRNALANYKRIKKLYENSNASRNELDSARANSESTKAQVDAALKALEIAQLNVSYTKLKASDECTIAAINSEVYENVSAGQEIVIANCGKQIEIEVAVPESLIQVIKNDLPAQITFSSISNQVFSGEVTEIGVPTNSGSNTFPVTILVKDSHRDLRTGLAAEIKISVYKDDQTSVLTIPAQAVLQDQQGRHAFVVVPSQEKDVGLIVRKPVVIGELTAQGIEIIEGLEPGDELVTAGVSVIHDGMRVKR